MRDNYDVPDRNCQLALRQPLPDRHMILMTDASFQEAGDEVFTENYPYRKFTSTRGTYAPQAYGSETFITSQIKTSIYAKEVLANFLAVKEFGNNFERHQKHYYYDSQQISYTTVSNQSDSTTIMDCMWFCHIVQFYYRAKWTPQPISYYVWKQTQKKKSSIKIKETFLYNQLKSILNQQK